jgi:hypothetical protein
LGLILVENWAIFTFDFYKLFPRGSKMRRGPTRTATRTPGRGRTGWRQALVGGALAAAFWALGAMQPLFAAELVMFEAGYCEWCERWHEEVGVVYEKTSEGRIAPLRRVDFHEPRPADLEGISNLRYTPTFILLDGRREVGRILGYAGEDHFWGLLGVLLDEFGDASSL